VVRDTSDQEIPTFSILSGSGFALALLAFHEADPASIAGKHLYWHEVKHVWIRQIENRDVKIFLRIAGS